MARPTPIIIPGGLSQETEVGFGQTGEALGQILGQFLVGRGQRKREEEAQQQFIEQFGSIFQQPVPAEGPQTEAMAERGVFPTADVVPPQVQGLIQTLAATRGGRELGQQQAASALKGLLTPAEAEPEVSPFAKLDPSKFTPESLKAFETTGKVSDLKPVTKGVGVGVSEVQSSSMLPSGLVQIVRKDGTTELVRPEEADKALIETAELRGTELQGLRASERDAAKNAQKVSINSFKQLAGIRKGMATMDDAIKALDEGAQTGAIAEKFPSFREASLKLKNAQARMGLNVIQNTTFGSLSESELAFALSAALPTGLDETALRAWIVEKREAQRKLSAYIEEAAIFLGSTRTDEKGIVRVNKIADFIKLKKETEGQRGAAATPIAAPQKIGRFTIEVE